MTEKQFDQVLINPTEAQLAAALVQATAIANYRARERKVNAPNGLRVFNSNEPEGIWWTDGGTVPKAYDYPAATSAVGYAWWTDPLVNGHIRVVGQRLRIWGGNPIPCVFGKGAENKSPKDVVYPAGYEVHKPRSIMEMTPSEN